MRIVMAENWEALGLLAEVTGQAAKEGNKYAEFQVSFQGGMGRIGVHEALGSEFAADIERLAQGY